VYCLGYMGQPAAEGGVAFLRTNMAPGDRLYPNIQLQLCCSLIGGIFKQTWNIKDEVDVVSLLSCPVVQSCYFDPGRGVKYCDD